MTAIDDKIKNAANSMDRLRTTYDGDMSDFDFVNKLDEETNQYRNSIIELLLERSPESKAKAYSLLKSSYDPAFKQLTEKLDEMGRDISSQANNNIAKISRRLNATAIFFIIFTTFCMTLAIILALVTTKSITIVI